MKKKILSLALVLVFMMGVSMPVVSAEEPPMQTLPDGTLYREFDDGQEWWRYPDDSFRTVYPTGWVNFIFPGGRMKNAWANGHITVIYRPMGSELRMRNEYTNFSEDVFAAYMPEYSGFDEFCIQLRGGEKIVGESGVVYDDVFLQFTALGPVELNLNNMNYIAPRVVHETITGHSDSSNVALLLNNGSLHINVTGDNSIRGQILIFNGELTVSGDGALVTDTFRYADGRIEPIEPDLRLDGASKWAVDDGELLEALDMGLVPDSISGAGWQNATTRLDAADAIALLIEKALNKPIAQIAAERGWDLTANQFSDTDSQAVTFLRYAGVTSGVSSTRYDPNGIYNRAQMVTMLWRTATSVLEMDLSGYQLGTEVFADNIPSWDGTNEAIGWAAQLGITTGVSSTRFDSFGILQNQQTGVFSFRAFDKAFS